MAGKSLETLVDEGVTLIRHFHSIEESKTEVLRQLASVVIKIRGRFRDSEGRRDWAGRSHEYRLCAARMYEKAGVPPDSAANIQAALRYHVGNLLREEVSLEELEDLGLLAASPRERLAAARSEVSALVESVMAKGQSQRARKIDAARLMEAAAQCLRTLDARIEKLGIESAELLALEAALECAEEVRALLDEFEKKAREELDRREEDLADPLEDLQ